MYTLIDVPELNDGFGSVNQMSGKSKIKPNSPVSTSTLTTPRLFTLWPSEELVPPI